MARRTIVLVVASAGVAALFVWQFLGNVITEAEGETAYVEVYRTTDFIAEGIESAVGSEDDLERALQGRVAAGPISVSSIIAADQWAPVTIDIKPLANRFRLANRR